MKPYLRKVEPTDKIKILGHEFSGLQEIKEAIEMEVRIGPITGKFDSIYKTEPKRPIEGLHVMHLYEPYPRFDSSDFEFENRIYSNFFFSRFPFDEEIIEKLKKIRAWDNYKMIVEDMDENTLPMVYYRGTSGDKVIIADKE